MKSLISFIPKKDLKEKVTVSNLKQYIVDGYKETRRLRKELETNEIKQEEYEKKIKEYEATLVVLEEFKTRDLENKQDIAKLKDKISLKNKEINNLKDEINNLKIIIENNKEENIRARTKEEYKRTLVQIINNQKGNLSKAIVTEIIENT